MVKSRSVKRNAKNARGLGRDRAPPLALTLAQARAKPQEVFSLSFFSRLWFALVFAASPLDLLPSRQTNRQLRTDTYP